MLGIKDGENTKHPRAHMSTFSFQEWGWSNSGALNAIGVTGRKSSCVFHIAMVIVNNPHSRITKRVQTSAHITNLD